MKDLFKSATLQLTLWYMALVVVLCVCFSAAIYHFARQELASRLSSQTERIYQEFPVFDNNPFWRQTDDLDEGSRHIFHNLIYFNTVVLIGAGFGSYWLARRTLKPIANVLEQQKRFTADASHELRTPLTAIKMESEVVLLDDQARKQDLRAIVQSNLEEVAKLETLINSLLRFSRLEAAELQNNFATIELQRLIHEAMLHVKKVAAAKKISIHAPAAIHGTIWGDESSFVQLIVILLDNALKYSPPDSQVDIDVSLSKTQAKIIITDRGSGIDPNDLKHVFDRFYRADKARNQGNTAGYGLGLSIAKQIADVHHGSVTLASCVGQGTTATVTVPILSTTETTV